MRTWRRSTLLLLAGLLGTDRALGQSMGDERPQFALPAALRARTILAFETDLTGPALTATTDDLHLRLLVARASRDTALVRATLREAEAAYGRLGPRNAPPPALLAETDLWLQDSVRARTRLAEFEARRATMDATIRWSDVPNGALLARADSLRAALAGPATAWGTCVPPITIPRRTAGAWQWRYDVQIWTRPPVAIALDTTAPLARVALVLDEVAARSGDSLVLRVRVRGAALDIPLLERLGENGIAFLRGYMASLRSVTVSGALTETGRFAERHTDGSPGPGTAAGSAAALVLAAGPLGFAPPLPGRALVLGDTWTDTVHFAAPGTALGDEPIPLPATLRLTGLRVSEGRRVAVVAVDASVRAIALGEGAGHADITLTGESLLDLTDGLPVRTAASLRALVRDGRGAVVPVRALVTALRQTAPAGERILANR